MQILVRVPTLRNRAVTFILQGYTGITLYFLTVLIKWKIAKQMLTIHIQDDGKTSNLSKLRGHQIQAEIPSLIQSDYNNARLSLGHSPASILQKTISP